MLDAKMMSFLAVCEERSVTKAAARLFITQPAVSQHLSFLEQFYGTSLFQRTGRVLILTTAGEILFRYATRAAADGETVRRQILSATGLTPLRFGATRTIGEYVLPEPLSAYSSSFPDVPISMLVDNTAVLLEGLDRGRIDGAFIEGIFDSSGYEIRSFMEDEFIPVCSAGDEFSSRSVVFNDILDRSLIVREAGSGSRRLLEHALSGKNLSLSSFASVFEIGNIHAIKDFVRHGRGITFLYAASVHQELIEGSLCQIKIHDFSVHHDYVFVLPKQSLQSERVLSFFEFCLNDRKIKCENKKD